MPSCRAPPRVRAPPVADFLVQALTNRRRDDTMRSKLVLVPILGTLLAVTSASSAAFADSPAHHDDNAGVRILKVTLTNTHETDLDLGAPGPSVGDRFSVFGDVVRNGTRAGTGGYE